MDPAVRASSVYQGGYLADHAFDGDRQTRWASLVDTRQPEWLDG